MRCFVACILSLSLLFAAVGCRHCERVESELRARENDVRELRDQLDRSGVCNQTLQHEVEALRGQLGTPLDGSPPAAYPVKSVALGRQTGGRSNDTCPGDDTLQVQFEPRDPDNSVIKAPGQLFIQAQEITPEGTKKPLSSWTIPPEQLHLTWRNGLLTTGYLLNLPWKVWPSNQKIRVTAVFQLPDGRVFEADRDITVRLTPINQRPAVVPNSNPNPTEVVPPDPQPAGEKAPALLPAPRLSDPAKPKTPAPSESAPGPFLGVSRTTQESAAEILRPVPLKPEKSHKPEA